MCNINSNYSYHALLISIELQNIVQRFIWILWSWLSMYNRSLMNWSTWCTLILNSQTGIGLSRHYEYLKHQALVCVSWNYNYLISQVAIPDVNNLSLAQIGDGFSQHSWVCVSVENKVVSYSRINTIKMITRSPGK